MRFAILFVVAQFCLCSGASASTYGVLIFEDGDYLAVKLESPLMKTQEGGHWPPPLDPDACMMVTVPQLQLGPVCATQVNSPSLWRWQTEDFDPRENIGYSIVADSHHFNSYDATEQLFIDGEEYWRIPELHWIEYFRPDGPGGRTSGISVSTPQNDYWAPFPIRFAFDGDANGDGFVDASDAGHLFGSWGSYGGDLNTDGITDAADAGLLFAMWSGDTTSVPEPYSGTLAAFLLMVPVSRLLRAEA